MHASFSIHHSNLQLTYTTQAWILKFKNLCHASKHMKCTFKCTIQVHELAPPTCVLKILIDSFPLSYLSPMSYIKISLWFSPFMIFLPLFLFLLLSLFLSPFVINDHKGLNYRQVGLSMPINRVMIIFPNLVQSRILAKDI